MIQTVIVCDGRMVDDWLEPCGPECGKRYPLKPSGAAREQLVQMARDAGWSVGPNGEATCPKCRVPPREVRELVRQVVRRAG